MEARAWKRARRASSTSRIVRPAGAASTMPPTADRWTAVRVGASGIMNSRSCPYWLMWSRSRVSAAFSISGRLSRISLAREPGNKPLQAVPGGKVGPRNVRQRLLRHGMPDKLGLHPAFAIERFLEGKDHQHAVHVFLDKLDAVFLPCPELRANKEEHRDAQAVKLLRQLEMNVGKVDQYRHVRPPIAQRLLQLAEFAVDARQVPHHLGDAHDRHVFRSDYALQSSRRHPWSAH